MASHHHHHHDGRHHHNHCESIPLPPTYYTTPSPPCHCNTDSIPCCTKSNQSPPPPNLDHLLHLIASYLQNQQQQRETQCSCETIPPRFNALRRQSFVVNHQQRRTKNDYESLLRKIDDLDLSLNRFYETRHSTVRDSAARVIQTHFRSYLIFRSKSLRELKELAMIKSSFLSLKSSVSGKTHFDFGAVSREATDLLLELDSIQGRVDPMTRDGKGSLSRELVKFLQYIGCVAARRREIVRKSVKDLSFKGKCKGSSSGEKLKKRIYVTSNGEGAELEEFLFVSDDGQGIPKSRVEALQKGERVKKPVAKAVKFGKKNRNVYEVTSSVEDDDGEEVVMVSRDNGVGSYSRSGVVVKGSGGKKRVIKTVSFDEDGNVYKVYGDTPEASVSEGDGDDSYTSGSNNGNGDGYNEVEDLKYVPKETEGSEEEEESHSEDEDEEEISSEGSKEKQVIDSVSHAGRNEHKEEPQLRKGSSMFSPPLPLKMEP